MAHDDKKTYNYLSQGISSNSRELVDWVMQFAFAESEYARTSLVPILARLLSVKKKIGSDDFLKCNTVTDIEKLMDVGSEFYSAAYDCEEMLKVILASRKKLEIDAEQKKKFDIEQKRQQEINRKILADLELKMKQLALGSSQGNGSVAQMSRSSSDSLLYNSPLAQVFMLSGEIKQLESEVESIEEKLERKTDFTCERITPKNAVWLVPEGRFYTDKLYEYLRKAGGRARCPMGGGMNRDGVLQEFFAASDVLPFKDAPVEARQALSDLVDDYEKKVALLKEKKAQLGVLQATFAKSDDTKRPATARTGNPSASSGAT